MPLGSGVVCTYIGRSDGVTSNWLCMCMWREGRWRAWSCYKCRGLSLCRCALLWLYGLANGAPWQLDFCFCPALTGVVHWSVLESRVRGVRFGTPSHNCVGVVGGVLAPWGPVVQLARSADVTTSHTTTTGSWEVHSDVRCGFSERRRGHPVGRIEPCVCGGGGAEVLFWNVSGANGVTAGGCLLSFAP
jgi:hypothetical protein